MFAELNPALLTAVCRSVLPHVFNPRPRVIPVCLSWQLKCFTSARSTFYRDLNTRDENSPATSRVAKKKRSEFKGSTFFFSLGKNLRNRENYAELRRRGIFRDKLTERI